MGFVGLCFHNTLASTAMWHMSLKKFQNFFFQKYNKSVCVSSKAHLIDFYDEGEGRPFLFSFLRLQTSCSFETIPKAAHWVTIGANWWIVITKPKVGAYYNDKVPWGCRRFRSWKGSATRIPCQSDPGLREVSPEGIELSILRPGLVNQS